MASQRTYSLPVQIDEDVLDKNPKFAQLLRLLSNKLTPDGVSVGTKQEVERAEMNIRLARQGWLMNHIPHYQLRELITDLELKSIEGSLTLEQEQLTEFLSQATAFSELPDYLPLPSSVPSQNHNLFGLCLEDLDRHNPMKHHLPVIKKAVIPMLEDRLLKKYKELHDFFTTQKESESLSEKQEDFSLPHLVDEKKQQLIRDKASLQKLKERRKKSFLVYYQSLLQCLSHMERIISYHKLEVQAVNDRVALDWMEAWCVANCTKTKLILLQLDCDTYTPKTVAALKVIRHHLDKAIRDTQRELSNVTQQVNAYRAVGSEFKHVVNEYTLLKKEIDDCKWGLQQFGPSG